MKVLIVEDETAAFDSLVDILHGIDPSIKVVANTESVSQTIKWINSNPKPDLILMDIHLSDGSSFMIFEQIDVDIPIIFTTAYDEYAIEAFKQNSIDYLLKPVKSDELANALNKFKRWTSNEITDYTSRISRITPTPKFRDKILVPIKDKLLPIDLQDVSCFYTSDKNTSIYLSDGRSFSYSSTLEQIFSTLNPDNFYRANKQFIVARDSVTDITIWFDNRLLITLNVYVPERIYVSKNKASDFKVWIVS